MKTETLEFPPKHINNKSWARLDSKSLVLESIDGMGKMSRVVWDAEETAKLKEFLDKYVK